MKRNIMSVRVGKDKYISVETDIHFSRGNASDRMRRSHIFHTKMQKQTRYKQDIEEQIKELGVQRKKEGRVYF